MRKIIIALCVAWLLSGAKSFSQGINLSTDSIALLLCKKWEFNYALAGKMKINKLPGMPELYYEFNKDKTYLLSSKGSESGEEGKWAYDAMKKIIKLTFNGKLNSCILSLKKGELIMYPGPGESNPNNPMEMRFVYKVRTP